MFILAVSVLPGEPQWSLFGVENTRILETHRVRV